MAELLFKVRADYEEVWRMRQELEQLRSEISKIDTTTGAGAARLKELSNRYAEVNGKLTEMVDLAAKSAKETGTSDYWIKRIEQAGEVTEETKKEVEGLVKGLNAWTDAAGKAFDEGNQKAFETAEGMVGELTKQLERLAKSSAPDVEEAMDDVGDAMDDMGDSAGDVEDATEALATALEGLGKKGLKALLDLPSPERGSKYTDILKEANIDVGSLAKSLLPLNSNIVEVGDSVVKALLKTPGGPVVKVLGAVAAAVASLAMIAIKSLINKMKEAREAAAELRQISQEETTTFTKEWAELDRLTDKLSKATEGSEEYQNTKNEIVAKFGKYDETLTTESVSVDYLRQNYDKLAIAIQQAAKERAYLASTEAITKRYENNYADAIESIYSMYQKEAKRGNAEVYQSQYELLSYLIDSGKSVEEIMNNVSGFTNAQRQRIERNLRRVVNSQTQMKEALEGTRRQFGIKDTSQLYKDYDANNNNNNNNGPKGLKADDILPEGSLAELKQRLSKLNEELLNEVTDEARNAAYIAIKEVEAQIEAMEARIGKRMIEDAIPSLNGITGKATTLTSPGLSKSGTGATPPKDNSFLGPNWAEQLEVLEKAADALNEFGDAVGGVTGDVVKLAADTTTAFISMAGSVKVLQSGVEGLEKASAIFAIIGAAVKVLTAVVNIVKANKEANEAATKAANEYARSLEEVADKARLLAEKSAFGSDAYGMFKAYSEQAQEAKKAFEALGSTQKKIVSDGRSGWQKFWGMSKNVMTVALSDFYDEMGNLDVERLSAWYDTYGDNLTDENRLLVENMISEWERYEDAMDGMTDYLSSLFGDTASNIAEMMITSFKNTGSALSDLSDLAGQFGENMAKSIVTSMLLDNVFTKDNQDKIKRMLLAGDASGAVTFYEELLEDAKGIAPTVTGFLQGLNIDDDLRNVDASRAAYQNISETTASAIEGRLTSLQISSELRNNILTQTMTLADDIRNIQAQAYIALIAIRDNTGDNLKAVKDIQDKITNIERHTRNL